MAQAEVHAELREPATAPDPVAEHRIHHRADEAAVKHKRGEFPTFSRSTSRNGRRGIHEHHLEQEETEKPGIISVTREEESMRAEQAEWLAKQVDGKLIG